MILLICKKKAAFNSFHEAFVSDCRTKVLSCKPETPVSSEQELSVLSATEVTRGGKQTLLSPVPLLAI